MEIYENAQFKTFRDKLEAEGFTLRRLWESKQKDRSAPDVTCFSVIGDGERPPAVGTIVVVDYGKDGFGLWFDSGSAKIEDDVRIIASREEMQPGYWLQQDYRMSKPDEPERFEWIDLGPVKAKDDDEARAEFKRRSAAMSESKYRRGLRLVRQRTWRLVDVIE